jgi:hypothetical protein
LCLRGKQSVSEVLPAKGLDRLLVDNVVGHPLHGNQPSAIRTSQFVVLAADHLLWEDTVGHGLELFENGGSIMNPN